MSLRDELKEITAELEALLPELQQKQAKFIDLMIRQDEIKSEMKRQLSPEGQ